MKMKIKAVLVNEMTQAMGIDSQTPVFHILWEDDGTCHDKQQTGINVRVNREDGYCVWEAVNVTLNGACIYYKGEPLLPKTEYSAIVQLTDMDGNIVETAAPVIFETGFMGTKWQAGWVEPVQEDAIEEKELGFSRW